MRRAIFVSVLALAACAHPRGLTTEPENRLDCAGPHSLADSAQGRLQGRVTDAETDAPIPDLQVQVSGRGQVSGAITDADGHWRLGDLPEGEYAIVVRRDRRIVYRTGVHLCPADVLTLRTPIRTGAVSEGNGAFTN